MKPRAPDGSFSREDTGRRIDTYLTHSNPMTTKEAAERCGIPVTTMRRYRLGELRPSLSAMEKLKKIGLTEQYVFGLDFKAEQVVGKTKRQLSEEYFIGWYFSLSAEKQKELEDLCYLMFRKEG